MRPPTSHGAGIFCGTSFELIYFLHFAFWSRAPTKSKKSLTQINFSDIISSQVATFCRGKDVIQFLWENLFEIWSVADKGRGLYFLAVQDSSISDLVIHLLTHSLTTQSLTQSVSQTTITIMTTMSIMTTRLQTQRFRFRLRAIYWIRGRCTKKK